jgi:hypothetical protein
MLHQNTSHGFSGDAKEVSPALPGHIGLIYQTQVRFVYQGCGLQGVTRSLAAKRMPRDAPEFVVHQRKNLGERLTVAVAPIHEHAVQLSGCGAQVATFD